MAASADLEEEEEEDQAGQSGRDAAPAAPAADKPRVVLKIKSANDTNGRQMRIAMSQPFSRLYKCYEELGVKEGWLPPGAKVTLLLDGEKVEPDQTPASLDLEDSDVLDARW